MVDSQSHEDYDDVVSRRKFVALTGAAGAAAVAGCLGGDDDDDSGNGNGGNGNGGNGNGGNGNGRAGAGDDFPDRPDGEPEPFAQDHGEVDQFFDTGGWDNVGDIQFNPFNPDPQGDLNLVVFEEFANYHLGLDEWIPHGATDWEIGESEITIELRDDLVWSNGDDVTAEDVVTGMKLQEHQDGELWDIAESVEADGDTTVVITLQESANTEIAEWIVLPQQINTPASEYGEYLERIEDDGEDPDDVMGELANWSNREPVCSGPFQFSEDESSSEYAAVVRNDEHPDELANFSGYRRYQRGSNEAYHQSFIGEEFDGLLSLFVPESTIGSFPDIYDEIQIPATFGVGLCFNHAEEPVNDVNVRRGIAYAVDAPTAAQNADPPTKSSPEVPVGIAANQISNYVDPGDYEAYEQSEDDALAEFEEAGYTMDGDQLVDGSGEQLELTLNYPSDWSDWVSVIETAADNLEAVGISVVRDGIARADLVDLVTAKDFQVAGFEWCEGAPQFNHPYYSLRHNLRNRQLIGDESFFNYPPEGDEVTVPSMDGSGEMTVNVTDRLADLASAYDDDEAAEIIEELAWVVNQDLPIYPIEAKVEQSFLRNDLWEYPDADDDYLQIMWPLYWLPKRGLLAATE